MSFKIRAQAYTSDKTDQGEPLLKAVEDWFSKFTKLSGYGIVISSNGLNAYTIDLTFENEEDVVVARILFGEKFRLFASK